MDFERGQLEIACARYSIFSVLSFVTAACESAKCNHTYKLSVWRLDLGAQVKLLYELMNARYYGLYDGTMHYVTQCIQYVTQYVT